ncbi:hypothetical protein [Photobacterium phosphoreum]|nr:hypothetical protein [Photobacterium phosphoreum]
MLDIIIAAKEIKNICGYLVIKKAAKIGSFFKITGCLIKPFFA